MSRAYCICSDKGKNLPPREKVLLRQAKGERLLSVTLGKYEFFIILKYLKHNQHY